jgi:hypothetical protein
MHHTVTRLLSQCAAPDAVEMATGGPLTNAKSKRPKPSRRKKVSDPQIAVRTFSNKQPPGLPRLNLAEIHQTDNECAFSLPCTVRDIDSEVAVSSVLP